MKERVIGFIFGISLGAIIGFYLRELDAESQTGLKTTRQPRNASADL